MPANPSMSHQSRLGIKKTATASDDATLEVEFLSCDLRAVGQHVQSPGIRGTRSYNSESVAEGVVNVSGNLAIEPRHDNLVLLCELILGGTAASGVVGLANVLPTFNVNFAKVIDAYRYSGCKISQAVWRSTVNQPLNLTLSVEGLSETPGVAFPAIGNTLSTKRLFMHHDLTFTLGGIAYQVEEFAITVNNAIDPRHRNSKNRVSLPETDRIVNVMATLPHTADEAALQSFALGGASATASWSDGTNSLTFDFSRLQSPYESAGVQGRTSEITRQFNFTARRAGTTDEIKATVVST